MRGPKRDGAERRLRRGRARNKTAAATNVRLPRREGAEVYIPTNKHSTAPWVFRRRFRRLIYLQYLPSHHSPPFPLRLRRQWPDTA